MPLQWSWPAHCPPVQDCPFCRQITRTAVTISHERMTVEHSQLWAKDESSQDNLPAQLTALCLCLPQKTAIRSSASQPDNMQSNYSLHNNRQASRVLTNSMFAAVIRHGYHPVRDWEIEFTSSNFNKVFDSEDWKGYCARHIPDYKLLLAMNYAQTCCMIEVGLYVNSKNGRPELHLDLLLATNANLHTSVQLSRHNRSRQEPRYEGDC